MYVMGGRVVSVSEKIPEDRDAVAWNHACGSTFTVLRWDDWPLGACEQAIAAHNLSGLDFSGVDLMLDSESNQWYTIEVNSAPSLPPNSDGSPSYRAKCMAKGLAYHYQHGRYVVDDHVLEGQGNWRDYIHPGIWSRALRDTNGSISER